MDVVDVLILALRLVFVAALYLFVYVVMRTVVAGVRSAPAGEVRTRIDRLRLVVLEPGASDLEPGQVLELSPGQTLGRTSAADAVVADPTVSAEHARIGRVGRGWVVSDLASTNGTRVNDAPVRGNAPLRDDDVLAVGAVRLKVLASAEAEPARY